MNYLPTESFYLSILLTLGLVKTFPVLKKEIGFLNLSMISFRKQNILGQNQA